MLELWGIRLNHQYDFNRAGWGLTELSNLNMIRPRSDPNDLLSDIFTSHYRSALSLPVCMRCTRIKTGVYTVGG
jgi:hypothetical protein